MTETQAENPKAHRKERAGRVISTKMDKTIIVLVDRTIKHPLVKKYISRHKKYYAHDHENTCNVGDFVRIRECRPLSKTKRWKLQEIITRAK